VASKPSPGAPGPHHHETGELNLNHPIGARRSIPLPLLREYHISAEPPAWTGPISLETVPPLVHNRPRPGRRDEPFIRNAIGRDK
jgi:hypothetical protein